MSSHVQDIYRLIQWFQPPFCVICGAVYSDETDEVEFWVGCDNCDTLIAFHGCSNVAIKLSLYPSVQQSQK